MRVRTRMGGLSGLGLMARETFYLMVFLTCVVAVLLEIQKLHYLTR
jgi:hypothetical protein